MEKLGEDVSELKSTDHKMEDFSKKIRNERNQKIAHKNLSTAVDGVWGQELFPEGEQKIFIKNPDDFMKEFSKDFK